MSGTTAPGSGGSTSRTFEDPWDGSPKIIVGIDIGTTQSGVSFAFLVHGAKPALHRVAQWPGQGGEDKQGKIPSVVWYDSSKKATSFGAEALTPRAELDAEDHGWRKARYFKLHLHPAHLTAEHGLDFEDLPFDVSRDQVYSDFLGYLLRHTQDYFQRHIVNGPLIWPKYQPTMEIIIAHPNGWNTPEQAILRSAVVNTGFINAEDAEDRVHFVTEAEASVHFCTLYSNIGTQLMPGTTFAVCDAGGSTIDTTVYTVKSLDPIRLEEATISACVQAGGIFIDAAAEKYLCEMFRKARLSPDEIEEYRARGVKDFELHAKRSFRDIVTDQSVEIAGIRFNDSRIQARRGHISLPGPIVRSFFDYCLGRIFSSISSQLDSVSVSHILLVGGFGESWYLHEQLKERFEPAGCRITTTSEQASKAVADGTIIWYCSNSVVKRVPWYSYGIEVLVPHDPKIQSHRRRKTVKWPTGLYSTGGWSQIVPKGVPVDCDSVTRRPYYREYSTPSPVLDNFSENLWCCSLPGVPEWMRFKPGSLMQGFRLVCPVTANLNSMRGALQAHKTPSGQVYWSLSFNVCIYFGRTEHRAFLEWVENGVTHRGPAHTWRMT